MSKSFILRAPTLDDAEAIADLLNACSMEQTGEPRTTGQKVRASMGIPGLNLETDTRLALEQGPQVAGDLGQHVAGYALVQDNPPSPVIYVLAEVHPQHRGKGIGTALCRWVEERGRQAAARPAEGSGVALLQRRLSDDAAARELLLGQGYRVVRYNFRMVIEMAGPPPRPMVPGGIAIRPFLREQEGRPLVEAAREAFRDNWGYVQRPFEVEYQRWMHLLDEDPEPDAAQYWFVALDAGEIVGFALNRLRAGDDPEGAEITIVGVRPAWRRRGIALALLQHSLAALHQRGTRRVWLEVDAENPTGAVRLYEKAGMGVERRYDYYEKELDLGVGGSA
jgi:mycothiol synthase